MNKLATSKILELLRAGKLSKGSIQRLQNVAPTASSAIHTLYNSILGRVGEPVASRVNFKDIINKPKTDDAFSFALRRAKQTKEQNPTNILFQNAGYKDYTSNPFASHAQAVADFRKTLNYTRENSLRDQFKKIIDGIAEQRYVNAPMANLNRSRPLVDVGSTRNLAKAMTPSAYSKLLPPSFILKPHINLARYLTDKLVGIPSWGLTNKLPNSAYHPIDNKIIAIGQKGKSPLTGSAIGTHELGHWNSLSSPDRAYGLADKLITNLKKYNPKFLNSMWASDLLESIGHMAATDRPGLSAKRLIAETSNNFSSPWKTHMRATPPDWLRSVIDHMSRNYKRVPPEIESMTNLKRNLVVIGIPAAGVVAEQVLPLLIKNLTQ